MCSDLSYSVADLFKPGESEQTETRVSPDKIHCGSQQTETVVRPKGQADKEEYDDHDNLILNLLAN